MYWQKFRPDIYDIVRGNVTLLDEYGVENTHSILRAQTKPYYTIEQLVQKAKSIFASKSEQHNFRSAFTPPHYYSFTGNQLNSLKAKAATILKGIFVNKSNKLSAGQYDIDLKLWGGESIQHQCLPLGYHGTIKPHSDRHCDLPGCILNDTSEPWSRVDGCWHAFHVSCLAEKVGCPLCQSFIRKEISRLANIARNAVTAMAFDKNEPSEKEVSNEKVCVNETSDDEIKTLVMELQAEILELCPPTLSVGDTLTCSVKPKVLRGNHCKVCGHLVKGHTGKDQNRMCPMCPNKICSHEGKLVKCQCDFDNSSSVVSSQAMPLSNSKTVTTDGVLSFYYSKEICQGSFSSRRGSNACTVISLLTGISFLHGELQLPTGKDMPEQVASLYKESIINGNGMYEACDLPDYQFNLSLKDIVNQINLPIKDPGPCKGIMVDGGAEANFDCIVAELAAKPGCKCLVIILNPDHALCLCINDSTIAVFDSHRFSSMHGAVIICADVSKVGNFLSVFHSMMRKSYGCNIAGANYSEIRLNNE